MPTFLLPALLVAAVAAGGADARAAAAGPSAAGAGAAGAAGAGPAFVAVVDPGHGGDQDGARAPTGEREKDLTLQIARRVARRLAAQGAKVILTRTGDISVPLANRAAIANAMAADLFVSIHLNSMPTAEGRRSSAGIETYFMAVDASDAAAAAAAARENADRLAGEPRPDPDDPVAGILDDLASAETLAESSRLAYAIQARLVSALHEEDRGVKQAPFYVLAGARVPAVLVEAGFISNPQEAALLRTAAEQERIAGGIAEGVAAWRAGERR